jgi:LPS sulfotransferase NodH
MQISPGYRGQDLVFVVGAPRSGTTWLQRLLASHPLVRTGQESKLFRWYLEPQLRMWRMETTREADEHTATGRGGTGLSCYFREEEFLAVLKQYMVELLRPMLRELKPGEIFLEKSPSHALCLGSIKELLPDCRIIHVLRDARDVAASLLAASRSWGKAWAPHHPAAAAALWVEHVTAVRKASQKLREEEFYEVRYEDLVAAPEPNLRRICNFLGLEWDSRAMRQAIERNSPKHGNDCALTAIPVYGEVAQRVGPSVKEPQGFIRKAKVGAWRTDLTTWEKLRVWYTARRTMELVGYSWKGRNVKLSHAGPLHQPNAHA